MEEGDLTKRQWLYILIYNFICTFIVVYIGIIEMKLKGHHGFVWAMAFCSGIMIVNLFSISASYFICENKQRSDN